MFSKKIMPVAGITLIGALLLTGCSTSGNGDNTTPAPTVVPSPVTEGAAAAASFASIYEGSITKANTEGYIATTTADKTEYIFSPIISKTQVTAYNTGDGTAIILPSDSAPGLGLLEGITASEVTNTTINGTANGDFQFSSKDNPGYKTTIHTTNGLITGMTVTDEKGQETISIKITYGTSAEQKVIAEKWVTEYNQNSITNADDIQITN